MGVCARAAKVALAGSACVAIGVLECGSALAGGGAAFSEKAKTLGINYPTKDAVYLFGFGCALIDLDNDGDADAVTMGSPTNVVGVYENLGGTLGFTDRSLSCGIPAMNRQAAVSAADYDADGDLDLFFTLFLGGDRLFRNDGGLTFTDVTVEAGILPDAGSSFASAWGDFDNDGYLDLYVTNRTNAATSPTENMLYHNQGDGTFVEVAAQLGVQDPGAPTLLCTWWDYDLDGDADLYLGTDKGSLTPLKNRLFQNQGDGTFVDVTDASGTGADVDCMGIALGDFDGNGHQDIYVTNIPIGNKLLANNGDGTFTDITAAAGVERNRIGWGTAFFDCNNDKQLDLHVCEMLADNRMYMYYGALPFVDESPAAGILDAGDTFSMALADIDSDGDLDMMTSTSAQPIRMYVNTVGQNSNWARFNVAGRGANTFGVGATVFIKSGGVSQQREVHAGANYKASNEMTLHFGLGQDTLVDKIETMWPGGARRTIRNYAANETWTLYPFEDLGDGNGNGRIDWDDFRAATLAYSGETPGSVRPGDEIFDMDGDGDVDRRDIAAVVDRMFTANSGFAPATILTEGVTESDASSSAPIATVR